MDNEAMSPAVEGAENALAEERQQVEQTGRNLYFGDKGELPHEARKVLVHLLQGPSIDHARQPNLWNTLVRYESVLRSRLSDCYLELLMDYEWKVAYCRQADTGEVEAPSLLREHQLKFYESLVLLYLRQALSRPDAQGLKPTVSEEEIVEHMVVYHESGDRHNADLRKRTEAAIRRIQQQGLGLLYKVPGSENRYEISRVLKLMLDAEQVQALRVLYGALATGDASALDESADDEDDDK